MDRFHHLIISIFLILCVLGVGTVGYMAMEGWGFSDALYMTVITLTTVGYNEVNPLDDSGRLFTMLLIVSGVGFFLYAAGAVVQFMVEGQIRKIFGRRILNRSIERLKDHYIVCGYGRIGRVLVSKLRQKPVDLVVIERAPELVPVMNEDKVLYLAGSATDEATLIKAGIERSKGLVAALGTDTENVFLVLTARQLNPDLYIMARASQEDAKAKMKTAGADKVESPYDMGATNMAQRILRPTVTNFLDFALEQGRRDIQMEEIPVNPLSNLVDLALKDSGIRQNYNLIIIAIKTNEGNMLFNPSFDTQIRAGETVIAVGEADNLKKLENQLNPVSGG